MKIKDLKEQISNLSDETDVVMHCGYTPDSRGIWSSDNIRCEVISLLKLGEGYYEYTRRENDELEKVFEITMD